MSLVRHPVGRLGLLPLLLLLSCGKTDHPQLERERSSSGPRAVRLAPARLRLMEQTVQVVGTLSAHDETTVAAQVSGQIEKCRADLGDRVKAGDELALVDTAAYEAMAQQAAANLLKARASAANAERNLKRVQDLKKDQIASTSELDQAVSEAGKTAADVKAAEAADAVARLDLERSRVLAPFEGAVAERIASIGDYVSAGTPILRLVNTDPLRLRLEVPERKSMLVKVGQPVRLTVEGDTNVYFGKLARVAPAIRDANRMLPVEADVPNQGALRAGLFARAQIIVNPNETGVSVPPEALVTFAGIDKVVLVQDGAAVERSVTTGRSGKDWVEIVSGVRAGEAVVLNPVGLRTGQKVAVERQAEPGPTARIPAEGAR